MSLNSGSLGQMLQRRGMEAMVATDSCGGVEQRGSNDEIEGPTIGKLVAVLFPVGERGGRAFTKKKVVWRRFRLEKERLGRDSS